MNLDLITKLAKLANNNPNENEANLAARKVCKLLEEGNFKFNPNQPVNTNNPGAGPGQRPSNYRSYSTSAEDIFRDIFRGTPYTNWEERRKKQEEINQKEKERRAEAAKQQYYKEQTNYDWMKTEPIFDTRDYDDLGNEKPKEPERRTLQCKKCGHHKSTQFVGHSSQFMCMVCYLITT